VIVLYEKEYSEDKIHLSFTILFRHSKITFLESDEFRIIYWGFYIGIKKLPFC